MGFWYDSSCTMYWLSEHCDSLLDFEFQLNYAITSLKK